MRERPIIFSSPMVRAILAGEKTQTRRAVKPQPEVGQGDIITDQYWLSKKLGGLLLPKVSDLVLECRYGKPGDRLWAREAWRVDSDKEYTLTQPEYEGGHNPDHIRFRANDPNPDSVKWRPSIFLPRWASRITLEIVAVRVERLLEISEEDAAAEGFKYSTDDGKKYPDNSNPWVWVIEFKPYQAEDLEAA